MKTIDNKVSEEVNQCIDILADFLKVEIKEKPKILFGKRNISGYNYDENIINISNKDISSGIAYFEEATHFLRDTIVPPKKPDKKVCEFFGRLGESISMLLVKNTDFEYLFKNTKPRNYSDFKFFEKEYTSWIDTLISVIEHNKRKKRMFFNSRKKANLIINCVEQVGKIINIYKERNNSEFVDRINREIINYETKSKKVGFEFTFNDLVGKGKEFIDLKNKLKFYLENKDYRKTLLTFKKMNDFSDKCPRILNKIEKEIKKLDMGGRNIAKDLYDHLFGYVVAEQYIKNDSNFIENVPTIFRQSDKEVFNNYFLKDYLAPYYKIAISVILKKFLEIKKSKLFRP